MESGTVEQTLPGLGAHLRFRLPAPVVGRAIGLTPNKRLMVVSGRSNPDAAREDRQADRL